MIDELPVAEAAERLLPPESPTFFDDFWERVRVDELAQARRRRRVTVASLAAAVAAIAAAAAFAAPALFFGGPSVLDRTYSCSVPVKTTAPALDLNANVAYEPHSPSPASFVNVYTVFDKKASNGFAIPQVTFSSLGNGLKVDGSLCRRSSRPVPLKPAGLAAQGAITRNLFAHFSDRCITKRRVLVHVRLALSRGVPVRGQLAIRNDDRKRAPITFVAWTPKRISYFLERNCVSD